MAQNPNTVENVDQTSSQNSTQNSKVGAFFGALGWFFVHCWKGIKEWCRKQIVSLKRRPNNIAMFFVTISMVYYTLNLRTISRTSADIGLGVLGVIAFWSTLGSILVIVLYMNAYPKRQKPKTAMLVLTFAFLGLLFFLDIAYLNDLQTQLATGRFDSYINNPEYTYIDDAIRIMTVHLVLIGISAVLCATKSLYGKLLQKINTSVEVKSSELVETVHVLEDIVDE